MIPFGSEKDLEIRKRSLANQEEWRKRYVEERLDVWGAGGIVIFPDGTCKSESYEAKMERLKSADDDN